MKKNKVVDYGTQKELQKLIDKWRTIVGVDEVYIINLKIGITENQELINTPAWTIGLEQSNKYPAVHICFNATWLDANRHDEEEVVSMVVHELIHIVLWDQLIVIDQKYEYEGLKARANEILTMKMTNAIMHAYYDNH